MHHNIIVTSIYGAQATSHEHLPEQTISFLDEGYTVPRFAVEPKHQLVITNVYDTDNEQDLDAPSSAMVEAIINFVQPDTKLLIHCIAGISRSTATAISLMVLRGSSVEDAVKATWKMRPNMWPNRRILLLFDDHMKAEGKFINSVMETSLALAHPDWRWCDGCKHRFVGTGEHCKKG